MKKFVYLVKLWERRGFLSVCVFLLILGIGKNCFAQSYFYDELNRLEKIVYEDGSYVAFTYDANGNITESIISDNKQNQTDYSKEEQGNTGEDSSQEKLGHTIDSNARSEINELKTDPEKDKTVKNNVGKRIKSKNATYEITSEGKIRTVTLIKLNHKKFKNFVIYDSLKYKGKSYKITKIAGNALKGQTKLQSVTIGKNVNVIGKNAFYGDKKLKKISVKTTRLKAVGKNAFKGIHKKAVIRVPDKKYTKYKKIFKGKGQKKTVQIKKITKSTVVTKNV